MYAGNVNAVTFLNFVTDKLCPNLSHLMAEIRDRL